MPKSLFKLLASSPSFEGKVKNCETLRDHITRLLHLLYSSVACVFLTNSEKSDASRNVGGTNYWFRWFPKAVHAIKGNGLL